MKSSIRAGVGAATLVGLSALGGPFAASASASPIRHGLFAGGGHGPALFIQTNDPTGNQVVSYRRNSHGELVAVGRYNTGGVGIALTGAVVDKLASQSSLTYDAADQQLIAVNGGSNSITAFPVDGAHLGAPRTVSSGGSIPVSVTVRGDLVYVLNAGGAGSVEGFYADSLSPIPNSERTLNLNPAATPQYLNTPGEIGLTPDGRQLVVTTKANGSTIDVFGVGRNGALSPAPAVNVSANPVPFGFSFDSVGDLVVAEAGPSALTTYAIAPSGTLTVLGSVLSGQAALCWVTSAGGNYFFGANAGSATVTGYALGSGAVPAVVSETPTDTGPIDLEASSDGSTLYVETGGSGIVNAFNINPDGSLTFTGSVAPDLPGHVTLEGIAST
jgi:6-phosphogluconolactonase (cycloisomerase 2 family)